MIEAFHEVTNIITRFPDSVFELAAYTDLLERINFLEV